MKKWNLTIILILSIIYCNAAYLQDVPTSITQPNGRVINCFITGDEFYRYVHDSLGYTIVKNPNTGYYVYALPMADSLTYSSYVVGEADPTSLNLPVRARWSAEKILAKRKAWEAEYARYKEHKAVAGSNKGMINNLVIFISFADDTTFAYTDYPTECAKFNDSSSATAVSVYNYYRTVSYGQFYLRTHFFPLQSDTTIISYHDIYNRAYYSPYDASTNPQGYTSSNERTTREHMLLHRAVEAVKGQIPSNLNLDYDNDGKVDNVAFIICGATDGWNELLWPHRWSLYSSGATTYINNLRVYDYNFLIESDNTVGVITHELMHTLGAPDLYHYSDNTFTPVGRWDLMASTNRGKPQGLGAYMKYKYGKWVSAPITITQPGTYTLYPANGTTTDKIAYKIPIYNSDEYLVLEYRRALTNSFDSPLNGSGILVYRINPNFHGNSGYDGSTTFDEIYVYRPNGTTTTDGSLSLAHFSSATGRTTISNQSNPYLFLCDGTVINGITISNITNAGDSIQFTYSTVVTNVSVNKTNIKFSHSASDIDTLQVTATGSWVIQNADTSWLHFSTLSGNSGTSYVYVSTKYENHIHNTLSSSVSFATPYNTVQVSITQNAAPVDICNAYHNMDKNDLLEEVLLPDNLQAVGEFFALNDTMVSDSMSIYFGNMNSMSDNDYIKVEICNANNSKKPASVIRTLLLPAKTIKNNAWNTIHFDMPIVFSKSFAITYYTYTTGDTAEGQALPLITADHTGKLDIHGSLLQKIDNIWKTSAEVLLNGKHTATAPISIYLCPKTSSDNYLNVYPESLSVSSRKNATDTIHITSNMAWQVCKVPSWLTVSATHGNGDASLVLTTTTHNNTGIQKDTICLRAESHVRMIKITRNPLSIYADKAVVELDYMQNASDSFKIITASGNEWTMGTSRHFVLQYDTNIGTQMVTVWPKRTNFGNTEREETIYFYNQTDTNFIVIKQKSSSTSIAETARKECKVYPNPAHQILNIQTEQTPIQRVEIFNILGQKISTAPHINHTHAVINVAHLPKGMYIIKIYTSDGLYHQNFSIK